MQVSFLLGPAGSGKTFRCLKDIRNELARDSEGLPLIFLAPKQATFQLERQLLESGEIKGYSRLHIFSFERLARFVFDRAGVPVPNFISEQGRAMVLRALLNRLERELLIFGSAAQRKGFAEELARQIREFINHHFTPERLRELGGVVSGRNGLRQKLQDFARIFQKYLEWIQTQKLQDSDALLGAASDLLERNHSNLRFGGIWVDGFAQLTPEERRLLIALLPSTQSSTLAFCLEADKAACSSISPWYLVGQTISKCKTEIETRYKQSVRVEVLSRDAGSTRFSGSPALAHLEANWSRLELPAMNAPAGDAILIRECADAEAEATCCAREIVRFVRQGGRFREAAVLVRDFNNDYPHVLRRVFRRYEIPFFLDHRESVSHHPLAELTRGTLRTIAYDWEQRDWFTVLKSGLIRLPAHELDQLENEALKRGWKGKVWRDGLSVPKDPTLERDLNRRREKIIPPFLDLAKVIAQRSNGPALAQAVRAFWRALSVEEQLEDWSRESAEDAVHNTVWEQMNAWLDDVALAFADQPLSLRQWIPILEAGLSTLTVGVIPPALDEVLIGAVDRSRNPDLKLLCILGFNEKVFPAVPGQETLLTEEDRTSLHAAGSDLVDPPAFRLAAEQFYGYIACTRAREKLRISYSRAGLDGKALNPSRFVSQLERIFPVLKAEKWEYPQELTEVLHGCELPGLGMVPLESDFVASREESLDPEIARRLYGPNLRLSVSKLERFASCPFRFFVERGLNVKEREEFKLDVREQGSFQHKVLQEFHRRVTAQKRKWRDLSTEAARALIGEIADEQASVFHEGLLLADHANRFTAENYKTSLQEFIHVVIEWFETNQFDPERVEFGFGAKEEFSGWVIDLSEGRRMTVEGRTDRIDLFRTSDNEALCVIFDYKSGQQKPDRLLVHYGIQQQLTTYLLAITNVPEIAAHCGVEKLIPVGGFLAPLRAAHESKKTRGDVAEDEATARRAAYAHHGIFDAARLDLFDSGANEERSLQFQYSLTSGGKPRANSFNALSSEDFQSLLVRTENVVRSIGEAIITGNVEVRPFRKGQLTACGTCQMQPVCRFDPWVQPYRVLKKPAAETK